MNDLEKTVWRASRGVPTSLQDILNHLLAEVMRLESRIKALEEKKNVGRPRQTPGSN